MTNSENLDVHIKRGKYDFLCMMPRPGFMTSDNGIADYALVLDNNMTQYPFVHYSVVDALCRS